MSTTVHEVASWAKQASRQLAVLPAERRNAAILATAAAIEAAEGALLAANARDLEAANNLLGHGEITSATYERLRLTSQKTKEMAESMRAVAKLTDPLGRVLGRTELDSDLTLEKISCPLGVLAVIFEARPDAVTQIAALALKSGNALILKPGREVEHTALELLAVIQQAIATEGIPAAAITMVTGRPAVQELLGLHGLVDLVIPRGSKQLVEFVQANTRIPVLGHAEGICHIYVDKAADLRMALEIVDDAKTDYPAACNAAETVLVHEAIAPEFLPMLAERLSQKGVRLRGCERTRAILQGQPVEPVTEANGWAHEYGDLELAIRVVGSLKGAIDHIHRYGSSHTESIVTDNVSVAEEFLSNVDAAGVFHNASTRFADGFRYGFGAEVGVSTSKLHARGPVGLKGLTTYKYILRGKGQVARNYRGPNARPFTHKNLLGEDLD